MNLKISASIFISLIFLMHDGNALQIDLTKFASKIAEDMNTNLGVRYVQDIFNNQNYDQVELKGEELLNALSNALIKKVSKVRDTLLLWKKAIEEDYDSTTNPLGEIRNFQSCCTYDGPLKFNYQFEREVDLQGVCELTFLNKKASSNEFRRLNKQKTKAFTEKAYKDMESKGLYIYYGQEDGYYLQYPGMRYDKTEDCYSFDPRTRPWYISAATQKSKDVVFLVDVSKNINTKLSKELVETFLKTLDPRDKIAVIPFATDLFLHPDHCYNSQLVQASPGNLLTLRKYVLSMIDKASTGSEARRLASYKKAFEAAFKQFSNTSKNPEKLIFLATAGIYNDVEAEVMQAIFDGNKKFAFQITISAFAVNSGMSDGRKRFYQDIVDQNCNLYQVPGCTSALKAPAGKFIHVTSESDMRKKFGSFYNFLNAAKADVSVRYSFPYVDFFGTGILIAVSIPTFEGSKLKGVASIDLVVSELLTDVTYFKEGHNAYRFLIEKSGLVYQHPLLPKPVLAFEPTVPVDISLFEAGKGFSDIRLSMISGLSDRDSVITERSFSRGDSSLEGAMGLKKNYSYFWQSVALTNFSLAVVIETSNAKQYELKDGMQSQSPMIYHRIDRLGRGPQYSFCRSTNYLVLKGNSTTKLPAGAFGSPSKYYAEETKEVVQQIMEYFSTNKKAFPTLLESQTVANSLKKSINLTSGLDEIWKKSSFDYISFRYIATEDGVFRIFPGVQIHPLYDPRSRPWYQRSLIYPDLTVISTPYLGATTGSMIITFSHLIQKKLNNTRTTVAVMGLDFSMSYFKKFLLDHVDGCRNSQESHSCIVVDKSGLVVFHPDFTKPEANKQLEGQHITKMVPEVAKDLINKKYLERRLCIGIYSTNKSSSTPLPHLQYFYLLTATKTISKAPTPTRNCPEYSLVPLPNTNVYVLVVPKRCLNQETCPCPKDGTCTAPIDSHQCHCPCKHFLACDEYLKAIPTTLVCPPPPTNLLLPVKTKQDEAKELKEAMSLQRCQETKCQTLKTWDNCNKIGCQWCFLNSKGELLSSSDQFCGYSDQCPRGTMKPVKKTKDEDTEGTNIGAIVGPIVALLVVAIVVVVVGIYVRRRKSSAKSPAPTEMKSQTVTAPIPRQGEVGI